MLEGGTFDELPDLRVVVTTLAIGGVLLAGGFGSAVNLLGSDYVVMDTDWPIAEEKSVPERLHKAFAFCGLAASQQQMIASGNTLKLLGVSR